MPDMSDKVADAMEVRVRIQCRKSAEMLFELAEEQAEIHGDLFWERLFEACKEHFPKAEKTEEVPTVKAMSDEEAKQFGKNIMPFGAFSGSRVDDVPLERLEWYADQKFVDNVRRYLRSKRIQREQQAAQDDDEVSGTAGHDPPPPPPDGSSMRLCLKCNRNFKSQGRGNRICQDCQQNNKKIYTMSPSKAPSRGGREPV